MQEKNSEEGNPFLDDLNGKFKARLRSTHIKVTSIEEGRITLKSIVGTFEASFNLEVLDRLRKPCFLALKRPMKEREKYLIYEVVSTNPMHYQQLSMDISLPKPIRLDFLEKIYRMWGETEDTWIDVHAVYTGYLMDLRNKGVDFVRDETMMPLVGAETFLLSTKAVEKLVNFENGMSIGVMAGFNHPLKVDPVKLISHHVGVFGFTGAGKSNLTSLLVRRLMNNLDDLKVIVIDIPGEYSLNLLDKVLEEGIILSTENYFGTENPIDAFIASQAIPETFLEKLGKNEEEVYQKIAYQVTKLFKESKVKRLDLTSKKLSFKEVLESFESLFNDLHPVTKFRSREIYGKLKNILEKEGINPSKELSEVFKEKSQAIDEIKKVLKEEAADLEKKRVYKVINVIEEVVRVIDSTSSESAKVKEVEYTPEKIALEAIKTVEEEKCRLFILYTPDPLKTRILTEKLISNLFKLRKYTSRGSRVLVVIDEAQEFIPDRVRREDYTWQSNEAVERLLRQGRKYRLHCWVATQRVAHLNVNAIQQIHSYFTGTLPRSYDRHVVAEAAGVSPEILEKTSQLEPGEWIFISHTATKRKNIPIFVGTENNEEIILSFLKKELEKQT